MDTNLHLNLNNESTKNKILIPHNSKLNNFKSNKYFINDQKNNSLKEALIKYIENNQKYDKNDSLTKSHPSNNSTVDISNVNQTKKKFNKNNTIKFDKNLINFAEPRTKVKEFHKIQPKVIDSFFLDNEDNMDIFFENDINNESVKEEINTNENNKNIKYNIINSQIYNKTIKMQSKNKKKFNLSITDTNDNEETIINENDYEDNESFYNEFENTNKQKKIISDNIKLNFSNDNIEYFLIVEKLYNELMKDLEVNEMDIYPNKLTIIKDFIFIFNDQNNWKLFNSIENMVMEIKQNNIGLILKEYLLQQLIFFYIIILIGLIKKGKNIFLSGLLNLSFYFHQSFIIFIYIAIININVNTDNNYKDIEIINNIKKCLKILDENITWLDKNNYEKYLQTNNNLSRQILINLLNQLKYYFNSNSFISKKTNNGFIEECINLLLSYLKSYKILKIINIIKEINNSFPINELFKAIKFDKIISHFSQDEKNRENEIEEFNIEDNIYKEEVPKEPFLKPLNKKYKYTLVLDLDETLVHYLSDNESAYIQIRPGAEEFLKELSEFYEIIIFTAAIKDYADRVIDAIDPDEVISDRLYRQHTINLGNANIKDLNKLGRNLKHVIIIDNSMENFSLQPKNGLNIIDFEGNEYDDELEYLKEDLIKLAKLNPDDVRDYLEDIQADMDKRAIYFLKINNEEKFKDELLNNDDNYYKNTLFSELINNKITEEEDKINKDLKGKYYKKGYSFTEESENIGNA